jgi:hypothetical protein
VPCSAEQVLEEFPTHPDGAAMLWKTEVAKWESISASTDSKAVIKVVDTSQVIALLFD